MLESRNISFSYDGKTEILRSVDLQIQPGEVVLLTGPTGSGKSTLAKCLSGFIPRSIDGEFSGEVIVDGENTNDYTIAKFSRLVSLVQQDADSQIVTLQVADEVAFGPENYEFESKMIENFIKSSLAAVDAFHLHNRITHTLSGGEKQRLAIAAMLSNQPKYLLLDEPSASLDPKGVLSLRKILTELKEKNVGILCIEHNLAAIRPVADRVLSISNGTISPWIETVDEPLSKKPRFQKVSDSKQLLSMESVSFSYDTTPVLQDVSMSIHEGEVIALMGENGSGKTTLVSILGGLLEPSNGYVHLGTSPISTIDRKDIARKISIVFQNPTHQIFETTVWKEQNLTATILGNSGEETTERSRELLQAANLENYLGRNPFSLSHGQKRRLNVTSILTHSPEILLLDEPFIGQDKDGREFILNEIASVNGASLIVTHNPNFAKKYCNRIIFVKNGKIFLDGSPEAVLKHLDDIGYSEYLEMEVDN
jgi:energy-coupling factor transport system ATP-binding protein